MSVQRCFIDILAPDVDATRDFYVELLGFRATFCSDWFVNLAAPDQPLLEIGILRADHDLVPEGSRGAAMLTIVVPDADAIHAAADARGVEIVEPPRDRFYGQRRLLLRDPAGTLVDVSSECAPDPAWMARVKQADDGSYHEAPTEA
jgi:catechol 2,3-dioxygenase-like lactoylglutathione lyase family enzyme